MAAAWNLAWTYVQARANELRAKPFTDLVALPEHSQLAAGQDLPGFQVYLSRDTMLNGSVAVRVEAFRNYLFGLYSRSIWDGFEKSPEGALREYERSSENQQP